MDLLLPNRVACFHFWLVAKCDQTTEERVLEYLETLVNASWQLKSTTLSQFSFSGDLGSHIDLTYVKTAVNPGSVGIHRKLK